MELKGKKIEFPLRQKLSFYKLFDMLEELASGDEINAANYAKALLKDLEPHPELREGTEDLSVLDKHKSLIDRLMRLLFPAVLTLNEIKGAAPPFSFKPFHYSKRMENILNAAGDDFTFEIKNVDPDMLYIMACATILQAHYGWSVNLGIPMVFEIPNKQNKTVRYYRSAFNADLMEIKPTESSIEITKEDYWQLIDDIHNIDLWKEKFPPHSWEIRGLGIINLMDITIDQSVNMMTSNLLEGTKETFDKVIDNIRSLVEIQDLEITFFKLEGDDFLPVKKYDDDYILLNGKEEVNCNEAMCEFGKSQLLESNQPFVISDTTEYIERAGNLLAKQLKKKKVKSYLITPLLYDNEVLGFLEMSSRQARQINTATLERLSLVLPILSMAARRYTEEAKNRMEAIIQKECTSIHPSVKWRFEEAAADYMEAEDEGERPVFENLVFNDVYPMYGQIDIKSSSSIRNQGVMADLVTQLKAVRKVMKAAIQLEGLPAYEEMLFRIDNYLRELKDELLAGSEQKILSFLQSDIYPVFDHMKNQKELKSAIQEYQDMLHPVLHMVYEKRRAFDESVGMINHVLADFIDEKQKEAQKMFPHYFERYKTDGVEYNMYIGQSITKKKTFSQLYLRNLQLWQLTTMCEMEHTFRQLQPKLDTKLEVASLILAYRGSLAIHFRMDEKRFDVEGAYNARYEIIKKRVDKAHIKGTDERVTVPNKIAIIYTSSDDAREYLKHIAFLESKGYIVPNSTEELELEDLQGITGLKALRVTVDYSHADKTIDIKNLIASLEG